MQLSKEAEKEALKEVLKAEYRGHQIGMGCIMLVLFLWLLYITIKGGD